MTNFGILMEINGIEDPFKWSRNVVSKLNVSGTIPRFQNDGISNFNFRTGLYYSPNQTRKPSLTSEGNSVTCIELFHGLDKIREAFEGHFQYIEDFIEEKTKNNLTYTFSFKEAGIKTDYYKLSNMKSGGKLKLKVYFLD
jgi:hypothetical protein